jgi:hypothetical protein
MGAAMNHVAVEFLQQLRPGGPWVLTAIVPDGATSTITARAPEEVERFIKQHNGKRNLYYSPNPTRAPLITKARKTDIAAIEYVLADVDPNDDETPEAAKARYRRQLDGNRKPTALVDSGNGLQGLFKLEMRIELGEPIRQNGKLAFGPEAAGLVNEVEERTEALLLEMGGKAGTQNIDRILRLPGTTNLPNKKKRAQGRLECESKLLWFGARTYSLANLAPQRKSNGHDQFEDFGKDYLDKVIKDGCYEDFNDDRSNAVWFVVNEMLRRQHKPEEIVAVLLDRDNRVSEHIYDQDSPEEYAQRQVRQAMEDQAAKIDAAVSRSDFDLLDPWAKHIVPAFAVDILAPVVREFVTTQAEVIGCDLSSMAMITLCAISGAINHKIRVKMIRNSDGWVPRPRLWVLLYGDA